MASAYGEQIGFASGVLVGTRNDITGATPRRFGILQEVQVDYSADLKQLHGQGRYALALAPGKTKVEIKAKFAGIRADVYNDLYFGGTTAATQIKFADSEVGTIPGSVAYTVTVSNSATWLADQGVFYSATGLPFKKVASAPAVGQYTVAAGVYTFAAADANKVVLITYTYSTTSGVLIPIANQVMGTGPSFQVALMRTFDGRQEVWTFNNCKSSKLALPTKQDDFTIFEMDFMVAADAAGNIGSISAEL